jgi:thioredoxin reductase (NADPH)
MYDLVILGSGPAGLSAAIAADKLSLKSALFGLLEESYAWTLPLISNYPGFPEGVTGEELAKRFLKHAQRGEVDIFFERVVEVTRLDSGFAVKSEKGKEISGKALILATGANAEINEKLRKLIGGKGVFPAGDFVQPGNVAQAVGEGARAVAEANVYVRTIPGLGI